jgi:two-component system response regulator MtrA
LVVDDDPHYARVLQTKLRAEGYEVLVTGDGQTTIEHIADQEPDLVVLASGMLGLDGYEVCRSIREFSAVPVIMLVTLAGAAYRVKGLCAGADQCVTKPVYIPELLVRIQAILRRVEIFERKGYHFVFQPTDTLDSLDQHLSVQD